LPTIEQVMDGLNRDPRELIETPLGKMERWCAETMLIGQTKGALSVFDAIRADATSQATLEDEVKLLRQNLVRACEVFADFANHVSRFVAHHEAIQSNHPADDQPPPAFQA